MDEGLSPGMPRLLRWILPAEFVRRVAEPAYDDLLADGLERGQPAVGLLATVWFAVECMWAAFPRTIFRLRRKVLAAVLATAVLMLVIVRERMAYGPRYSSHQRDRLLSGPER